MVITHFRINEGLEFRISDSKSWPFFHIIFGQLHPSSPFILVVMFTIKSLRVLYHFLRAWCSEFLASPSTLVRQASALIYNCWSDSWIWKTKSAHWGRKKKTQKLEKQEPSWDLAGGCEKQKKKSSMSLKSNGPSGSRKRKEILCQGIMSM